MTLWEMDEAIEKIEDRVARTRSFDPPITLTRHRWEQVLRILKFYRLKWDILELDPVWYDDQSDPESPFFHKGQSKRYLADVHRAFVNNADRRPD